MGTQTGPNRLVGNADYPSPGAYASVRRANTRRVERPQTRPGLIRTWCSVVHAITHSAPTGRLLNESQSMRPGLLGRTRFRPAAGLAPDRSRDPLRADSESVRAGVLATIWLSIGSKR